MCVRVCVCTVRLWGCREFCCFLGLQIARIELLGTSTRPLLPQRLGREHPCIADAQDLLQNERLRQRQGVRFTAGADRVRSGHDTLDRKRASSSKVAAGQNLETWYQTTVRRGRGPS